jgi:hypothetical protein
MSCDGIEFETAYQSKIVVRIDEVEIWSLILRILKRTKKHPEGLRI